MFECFTSQYAGKGKKKVVSNPGTAHVGTIITSSGPMDCTDTIIGKIPKGYTIYARAHVKFKGPVDGPDEDYTFGSSVSASGLPDESDTYTITENPASPACVNGLFDD